MQILQNSNSACHCVPTGHNGKGKIVVGKGKGKGTIVLGKGKGKGKRAKSVSEDWRPSRWTALP
jgi:hypothetical protein